MFYEEFINHNIDSDCRTSITSIGCENIQTVTPNGEQPKKTNETTASLTSWNDILSYCQYSDISLEDDNPFADLGGEDGGSADYEDTSEDSGEDNPFGGDDGDSGGDNPFDDFASDDGGDDIFGSDNDDEEKKEKKGKGVTLDRKKVEEEEFDMSVQVRTNFSKKFLELDAQIDTNIDIIDRTMLYHPKIDALLHQIKEDYRMIQQNIRTFGSVVVNKTYEDIFAKYIEFHTQMIKLKRLYLDMIAIEK